MEEEERYVVTVRSDVIEMSCGATFEGGTTREEAIEAIKATFDFDVLGLDPETCEWGCRPYDPEIDEPWE